MTRRFISIVSMATIVLLAVSFGTAVGQTTDTACGNAPAGYNVIESNSRFVIGTPGNDFICAGDANNIIRARGLHDIIYAGGGNDVIWAGFGNDSVHAGDGNDLIRAGNGLDRVWGEGGNDIVFAGFGPDIVRGGDGDDHLTGGDGHDVLHGGAGVDWLIGNKGIDMLFGNAGNDTLQGGIGPDSLLGGEGNDVLSGGDHDDVLGGGNGRDRLLGGNGSDVLTGGNDADVLRGGGNPDLIRGGAGDDTIDGGNGLNIGTGGDGVDSCLNVDSPVTTCEIVDGIDSRELPARVIVSFPTSGTTISVEGRNWSPSTTIDVFRPLLEPPEAGTPVDVVPSSATGAFTLAIAEADLDGRFLRIEDSVAGRIKSLIPILESYTYVEETKTLTVMGPTGKTMEAFVRGTGGELIFVEQLTFDETGSAETDFREILATIGAIDLMSSDDDGDVEMWEAVFSSDL